MTAKRTTFITLTAALVGAIVLPGCVDTGATRPDGGSAGMTDLSGLVGMRAQNLDSEMNRRGFTTTGGYQAAGVATSLWYKPGAHQCVKVETREGRVASTENIVEGNCR